MKVVLRQWKKDDIEQLALLANNKKIADNLRDAFHHPYTLKDAEEWIASNERKSPVNCFAIEATGELVGGCGIFVKEDVYRYTAEIGYWIAEPFWKKGIATESIKLMLEKINRDFPFIIRVYAEVFEHNKASMKALEKNGFHLEGIREKAVIKNNKVINDYVWVKLLK